MRKYLLQLIISISLLLIIPVSYAGPITGNPKGTVTLVEYYDYECAHCRRMERVIDALQAQYSRLRVIHRAVPLLSPESRRIASVALAAKVQGKWLVLHKALTRLPSAPTIADVSTIAKRLGLNTKVLFNDMQKADVQQELDHNIKSAERYAIHGAIYLPILVFKQSNGKGQDISLAGEQSYALLSAIVQQLGVRDHV